MKNPLRKRLLRELTGETGKYMVIFLFMTVTIGFVSGFLVAGSSMLKTYNESFQKYNIEDGHFVLDEEAEKPLLDKIEEKGVSLYENFYSDLDAVYTGEDVKHSTLRVYAERDEVDLVCLMEGEFPDSDREIGIDRMYADNNGIAVGDTIQVASSEYRVSGLLSLSDYSALFSDNSDMMFDSIQFGVAIVTEAAFEKIPDAGRVSCYSWKYDREPSGEQEESDMAEEFMEDLAGEVVPAGFEIEDFLPRYLNQAIRFTGDDMGSDRALMMLLLYILTAIIAFVFSVTIRHTIVRESAVIGTLRASGYTRGEMLRHYLAPPMTVTIAAAIAGNILGYTVFKNVVAALYYNSYSLVKYETAWNGEAFWLTTVVPLAIMFVLTVLSLYRNLKLSPLRFIRRDLSRAKHKRAPRLPDIKFMSRFRLRIIWQNASGFVTLFVGILFSNVLLLFGMMMGPLLTHYQDQVVENMFADYQYVLSTQVYTECESAEKFSLCSLKYREQGADEDFSVYGIRENSRYVSWPMPEDGVCISTGIAEKYRIRTGDDLILTEPYGSRVYHFPVRQIVDYPAAMAVFMSNESYVETFDAEIDTYDVLFTDPGLVFSRLSSGEGDEYFNGYFSDRELTDIDGQYIAACVTEEDMTKVSRQLDVSMGSMFYMINVFAVVMAALILYLLTKLILERNAASISIVKILGYENGEIARLYLFAVFWVVVFSQLLGMAAATWIIRMIWRPFMMKMSSWLPVYFPPRIYPMIFAFVLLAYGLVALLQFRHIQKGGKEVFRAIV